jgi:hypothetical protein
MALSVHFETSWRKDAVSKSIHIAGETRALTFANNLIAFAGLLVLGFPVTSAAVKTAVVSWVLLMTATMQLVRRYVIARAIPGDAP